MIARLIDAFFRAVELSWIRFIRDLHSFAGRPYFFNKITLVTVDGEQQATTILEFNEQMVIRLSEIGYDTEVPEEAVRMFVVSCVAPEEFGFDDE